MAIEGSAPAEQWIDFLRRTAQSAGFDLVGVVRPQVGLGYDRLTRWLEEGRHGEMQYMARQRDARADAASILPGVRGIIMVALAYRTRDPIDHAGDGRVSRYAWGEDYHEVLRARLKRLARAIEQECGPFRWRAAVDSAPLMERDYAVLAGLGWIGKNTLLINPRLGSFFFLGALLTDREWPADPPFATDHCGTCTRCLEACPTQAFDGPYRLDARKCISYLTIEHRTEVPASLANQLGNWVFGCDVCQEVCPWNIHQRQWRDSDSTRPFEPSPGRNPIDLRWLLRMSESDFRSAFEGSAILRSRRFRLIRSAALAAGNLGRTDLLPDLEALTGNEDASVRAAAKWAIHRIQSARSIRPNDAS